MKKILLIIAGMVLAAALVYAGWISGARTHFMTEAFSVTVVDKALTELTMKELMLNQLQEGKIEDVKHSLQMEIDGSILTVDAFRDEMDERSLNMMRGIFSRIAQDRSRFTNGYTGDLPKMDLEVGAKINLILKWMKQGARPVQEDFVLFDKDKNSVMVADGFGGPISGVQASRIACESIRSFLFKEAGDIESTMPFVLKSYFSLSGNVPMENV
jgi:hypothetical protein